MAVNGPTGAIYKVKPLYEFHHQVNLPTCMYKTSNIFEENRPFNETNQDETQLAELEKRQLGILKNLEDLKCQIVEMKKELNIENCNNSEKPNKYQDIVIKASPNYPPLSVWAFYYLLAKKMKVQLATFIHSSLVDVPESVRQLQMKKCHEEPCDLSLTIVWKDIGKDSQMMVNPIRQGVIEGEVNIARYLSRLISFGYDNDPITSTQVDNWLEMAHSSLIHGTNKERQATLRSMNSCLGKNNFLVGNDLSLADIVMWSTIIQTKLQESLPSNVTKWWKSLNCTDMFQVSNTLVLA